MDCFSLHTTFRTTIPNTKGGEMDPFITATDSGGDCIAQTPEGIAYRIGPEGPQLLPHDPTMAELLDTDSEGLE